MFSFLRLSFFKITKWPKSENGKHVNTKDKAQKTKAQKTKAQKNKVQKKNIKHLECFICKKRLKPGRIHNLKRHLELHSKDLFRYKCVECSQTYSTYGNFLKHLPRVHANQNPDDILYVPTDEGILPRPFYQ